MNFGQTILFFCEYMKNLKNYEHFDELRKNLWFYRNFRKEWYFQKYYFYEDVKYM